MSESGGAVTEGDLGWYDSTVGPADRGRVRAETQVVGDMEAGGVRTLLPQASKVRSFQAGGMTTPVWKAL